MEKELPDQQPNSYELKKEEKLLEQKQLQSRKTAKKMVKTLFISAAIIGPITGLVWYGATLPKMSENEIVSKNGLHWHPELSIVIKGQKEEIPANIGIGVVHKPIHTHDSSGIIHLEIQGLVKKDDLRLGKFFKIWNKPFNAECIFDFCNSPNAKVKMFVNNKENLEFENYQMKDKDKIEIKYE